MWMELSHPKGILSTDVGLYLVDTWDTKYLSRCSSAVRCFTRSDMEISFSNPFHQPDGVIGYRAKKTAE